MVASAQRLQIVQCMGVRLTLSPRHNVVNMNLRPCSRHSTANTTAPVPLQRCNPIANPAMGAPTVRVCLMTPRWRRRAKQVLSLPRPVAVEPTERTPLRRALSHVRLPPKRLRALDTHQLNPSCLSQVSTAPRAVFRLAILSPVPSFKPNLTLLAVNPSNRHVHAPSIVVLTSLPATTPRFR